MVSGINRGGNLGDDVFYSGTVGGAREGTFFGVPSIAVSLAARADLDFTPRGRVRAPRSRRWCSSAGLPERTLLNVNVPPGKPTGVAVTVQGRREHEGTILEGLDPRRRTYYWIEEGRDQLGERRDVRHPRDPLGPHLGHPAADRHHPPRASLGRAARVGARRSATEQPSREPLARLGAAAPPWYKSVVIPIGAWLSLARALGSGPRGRRFESSRPDQLDSAILGAARKGAPKGAPCRSGG